MKNLLLVAFHFPPYSGGSGVHRASKFARYLPENGWHPCVLSCRAFAYEKADKEAPVFPGVEVVRAFALDAQRHLGIQGRHLRFSALPDRWANWAVPGIPAGLFTLYAKRIPLILVTYPIATAVLIAVALQWLTGKPLVIDFRDSMSEENYPAEPAVRAVYRWIEKRAIKQGARFIFTTESTRQMYLARYPKLVPSDCIVIPNGYDEEDFSGIDFPSRRPSVPGNRPLRLVHAGLIYPDERDPRGFFRALEKLKLERIVDSETLSVDLRAPGAEDYYRDMVRQFGIDDLVHILPALSHFEALRDTAQADGLLLFQAASCNHQIPAKVYEYLRVGKPILALTDASGDTATLLKSVGGATLADLADVDSIYNSLIEFMTSVRTGAHSLADRQKVQRYTRRNETTELARVLDELSSKPLPAIERKSVYPNPAQK